MIDRHARCLGVIHGECPPRRRRGRSRRNHGPTLDSARCGDRVAADQLSWVSGSDFSSFIELLFEPVATEEMCVHVVRPALEWQGPTERYRPSTWGYPPFTRHRRARVD